MSALEEHRVVGAEMTPLSAPQVRRVYAYCVEFNVGHPNTSRKKASGHVVMMGSTYIPDDQYDRVVARIKEQYPAGTCTSSLPEFVVISLTLFDERLVVSHQLQ